MFDPANNSIIFCSANASDWPSKQYTEQGESIGVTTVQQTWAGTDNPGTYLVFEL